MGLFGKTKSAVTAAFFFLLFMLGGCVASEDELETVKVGYLPVSTTLPNWVAEARGINGELGLRAEFVRFANANLMLSALISGEIDATSVIADEPLLVAASNGLLNAEIYLQEVLTRDRIFDAIIVKKNSDIRDVSDLEGKTIVCFPGSQLKNYLRLILEKAGVNPETVEIQQMPPPNILTALAAGSVDAALTLEPFITIGSEKGVSRVIAPSPISTYIGEGPIPAASYLVSSEWVASNTELADRFVQGVYRALDRIESDYSEEARLYPEFSPIEAELGEKVEITEFARYPKWDRDGLAKEVSILRDAGLLGEQEIDVDALFYRSP